MNYCINLLVCLLFACFSMCTSSGAVEKLSPDEFEEALKNTENAVLLDVRTLSEYEAGHIEGSVNIDYKSGEFESTISELNKSKTYFVYCRGGGRSASAAKLMHSVGIENIYELKGGINAWKKGEKPIVQVNAE